MLCNYLCCKCMLFLFFEPLNFVGPKESQNIPAKSPSEKSNKILRQASAAAQEKQHCDLRSRDARFPCDHKSSSERRLSLRLKRAKLIPIAEMRCDIRICAENSLANGDARFWCTQAQTDGVVVELSKLSLYIAVTCSGTKQQERRTKTNGKLRKRKIGKQY